MPILPGIGEWIKSKLYGYDYTGSTQQQVAVDPTTKALLIKRVGLFYEISIPAGSWNYPTSNPAPLDRDVGTNGGMFVHAFNDTTEEFIILEPAFELPANLDTSGTVYFSLFGYAKTANGGEVQFRIYHSSRDKGESWDNAYSTKDSGDYTTDASQDSLDQIEWSETVANLGWAGKDLVRLKLSRIAINDGTPVSGDYYVTNLKIRIPVT